MVGWEWGGGRVGGFEEIHDTNLVCAREDSGEERARSDDEVAVHLLDV